MSNDTIQMHPDTVNLVSERARLWSDYDALSARTKEIDTLNQSVNIVFDQAEVPKITPLAGNISPKEIESAIQEMRLELGEIAKLEGEVRDHEVTIANIRSRLNTIYVTIGIVAVILLLWLFIALAQ